MSQPPEMVGVQEVPLFSECVLGYRAWTLDRDGQLWPLSSQRRPWAPGINVARCNCENPQSLQFEWSWYDGRRVLEPAPAHAAPDARCDCGLYSWRRPLPQWQDDERFASGQRISGAVASWGHLQVHDSGFRAEHACVVTLAYPEQTTPDALTLLEQVADHYRVDLVPLADLEQAASQHGTPFPDWVTPSSDAIATPLDEIGADRDPFDPAPDAPPPAPDATVEEVGGRRVKDGRRRIRHLGLISVCVMLVLIAVLLIADHRSTPCHVRISGTGGPGTIERCYSVNHHK
jgi:hypothetical protein